MTETTTSVAKRSQSTGAVSIWSRVSDPIAASESIGKWLSQTGMLGVKSPGEGAVVALSCMCDNMSLTEHGRRYHMVDGKQTMRADRMLAEFRAAGGRVKWLNVGDDGKEARAEFEYDGQSIELAYTVEDGRKSAGDKFDKLGSNWQRDVGSMLRARLTTKAVRILAPELIAGVYDPGELADAGAVDIQPQRSADQVNARRAELEAMNDTATSPAAETVVDVPFETASAATAAEPEPEPTNPQPLNEKASNDQLQKLVELGSKLGKTTAEVAAGLCSACKVDKPQDITSGQADKLIERWSELLAGN